MRGRLWPRQAIRNFSLHHQNKAARPGRLPGAARDCPARVRRGGAPGSDGASAVSLPPVLHYSPNFRQQPFPEGGAESPPARIASGVGRLRARVGGGGGDLHPFSARGVCRRVRRERGGAPVFSRPCSNERGPPGRGAFPGGHEGGLRPTGLVRVFEACALPGGHERGGAGRFRRFNERASGRGGSAR